TFQDRWAMPLEELEQLPGYRQPKDEELAEARQIMDALGYGEDGLQLTTIVNTGFAGYQKYYSLPAAVIDQQLRKIGIDVGLKPLEFGAWNEAWQAGDFDLTVGATAGGEDPWTLFVDLHSAQARYYKDDRLDGLIDSVMTTIDEDARIEAC